MMPKSKLNSVLGWLFLPAVLVLPHTAAAATWQLTVGSQWPDCQFVEGAPAKANCQSRQGMAFEPNEVWIHTGDSVTWTHRTGEGHTVTFLKPGQVRPSFAVGCPGTSPDHSDYDPLGPANEQCVNSGVLGANGATYTVHFPQPGNYKFTCLIHAGMYGAVHVLPVAQILPHDQKYYDSQAKFEAGSIYNSDLPANLSPLLNRNQVATGGMLVSSGGGWGYETVMRFQQTVTRVHVGDTVEWINFDPVEPHTVTFGCPTDAPPPCQNAGGNPFAPFSNVGPIGPGLDGAVVANMTSNIRPNTGDGISSGFLIAARQDATGQVPANLATTKFRVTFNFPGTYRYICELHDELGMIGWVVVLPKGVDEDGDKGDN